MWTVYLKVSSAAITLKVDSPKEVAASETETESVGLALLESHISAASARPPSLHLLPHRTPTFAVSPARDRPSRIRSIRRGLYTIDESRVLLSLHRARQLSSSLNVPGRDVGDEPLAELYDQHRQN